MNWLDFKIKGQRSWQDHCKKSLVQRCAFLSNAYWLTVHCWRPSGLCFSLFHIFYLLIFIAQFSVQYGVLEVTNHKSLQKSVVSFKACGWFGNDLHKVEGFLFDRQWVFSRLLALQVVYFTLSEISSSCLWNMPLSDCQCYMECIAVSWKHVYLLSFMYTWLFFV